MTRLYYILAGVAVMCVGLLMYLAMSAKKQLTYERNYRQTEPARRAKLEKPQWVKDIHGEVEKKESLTDQIIKDEK